MDHYCWEHICLKKCYNSKSWKSRTESWLEIWSLQDTFYIKTMLRWGKGFLARLHNPEEMVFSLNSSFATNKMQIQCAQCQSSLNNGMDLFYAVTPPQLQMCSNVLFLCSSTIMLFCSYTQTILHRGPICIKWKLICGKWIFITFNASAHNTKKQNSLVLIYQNGYLHSIVIYTSSDTVINRAANLFV